MSAAPIFEPIRSVTSDFVYLTRENIDTDQIIPARFLTTTTRDGLGDSLFYHWRYDERGVLKKDALFNHPSTRQSKILVAARNFGCGSSREHAPWALYDYGFRAILSPKLGDIFRANCLKNGMLAIEVSNDVFDVLADRQGRQLTVDPADQMIRIGDDEVSKFNIDGFSRACLMGGNDQLGFLLGNSSAINAYEIYACAQEY